MEDFSNIINWDSVDNQSNSFKNQTPFRFAFIEDFFEREFYEKLFETYPKIDETWTLGETSTKTQFIKFWNGLGPNDVVVHDDDPQYSEEWNKLKRYVQSEEFVEKIRKFSGVPVNKVKSLAFMLLTRGGYQLPHIHDVGPSTLILMLYFSKNWNKGDPGGTYVTTEEDESKMIFEPYNLDNSVIIFQDGPNAGHGVRRITKDVERRAIQIYLEKHSSETGWSAYPIKRELREI